MIIALSGPAGCGKSTAAAYLAEHHGFARVRFAGPLKAMLRAYCEAVGVGPDMTEAMVEGGLSRSCRARTSPAARPATRCSTSAPDGAAI